MTALHCVVRGRVQGVGFRYSAMYHARSLNLSGWVKNNFDGSVETRAVGHDSDIRTYLAWIKHGPATCRVDSVDIRYMGAARDRDRIMDTGDFQVTF